jgi:hypothetical protein
LVLLINVLIHCSCSQITAALHSGLFQLDLVGLAGTIADSHAVEDAFVLAQLGLQLQQLQLPLLDVVGAADEVLVLLEQGEVLLLDRHAVVQILHLIITYSKKEDAWRER